MKKQIFFTILVLFILGACSQQRLGQSQKEDKNAKPFAKLDKYDRMDLAMEHEFELTKDPQLNIVPRERLYETYELLRTTDLYRDMTYGQAFAWENRGPDNVGGRTRAIMVDPNDSSEETVWAGSVAGGLWKTTNISADDPQWKQVDDFMDNLAIGCLTYDPNNTQLMYFGTGEGWYNGDRVRGDGIWRSLDGGETWAKTNFTQSYYVQKIVIDADGYLYAGTEDGIWKSIDRGDSWTDISPANVSNYVSDLAMIK